MSDKPRFKPPLALVVMLAVLILVFSVIILVIWLKSENSLPVWVLLLLLIAPAAITVGAVVLMCRSFAKIAASADDKDSK